MIINDMKKEEVRKSYTAMRNDCKKNMEFCLNYLLTFQQKGLIHHLVDMENLTTVEKQYIHSLAEVNN